MDVIAMARSFFGAEGRDIDRARFEHHFGDLSREGRCEALAALAV